MLRTISLIALHLSLFGILSTSEFDDFPLLPRVIAPIVNASPEPQWLAPHVGIIRDRAVILDGIRWVDSGPDEGLALIACLNSGRLHESLIRLNSDDAALLKSAFIVAFGWPDGATNDPLHDLPPRGVPVRVEWEWQDANGLTRRIDVSCLVRDRVSDRGFPPLPLIYAGSRIGEQRVRALDGSERLVPSFKLAEHRTFAALFDENDALLSTPLPFLSNDLRMEVHTALAPIGKTTGRLIVSPATLALTLWSNEHGELRAQQHDGAALDDHALITLLQTNYRQEDALILRALAIRPALDQPRTADRALVERLLKVAVAARCWVVPIIQP